MELQETSIMTELVHEVKSYLPDMKEFLRTLNSDSGDAHAVEELHRMAHTIRGASSMVGLQKLSETAVLLENSLEEITAGETVWNNQLSSSISEIVDEMGRYCEALQQGDDRGDALHELALRTLGEMRVDEDSISLEQILFADSSDGEADTWDDDLFADPQDDSDNDDELFCFNETEDQEDVPGLEPSPEPESAGSDRSLDLELLESFNQEAAEHLEQIFSSLNTLSSEITAPVSMNERLRDHLHIIRRGVHTLKGAAAVIGIDPVAAWGHEFEDFLDWLHDKSPGLSPEIINAMLSGSDLLESLTDNPELDGSNRQEELSKIFKEVMASTADDFAADAASVSPQNPPSAASLSQLEQELRESFNEEAAEHLEQIFSSLNTLSSEITAPVSMDERLRDHLHIIRRGVHTLKGAAAVIGIDPVAAWGHEFEDFLDWLHDESSGLSPEIINAMLSGSDLLESLADNPELDGSSRQPAELLAQFSRIMAAPGTSHEAASEAGPAETGVVTGVSVTEQGPEEPDSADQNEVVPAPQIDAALQESFDNEAEEYLEVIGRQLNLLSSIILEPTFVDRELGERLDALRRSVHGLKGAADVVGFSAVAQWAHLFEDFLGKLLQEKGTLTPEAVAVMLGAADGLEKIKNIPEQDISRELEQITRRYRGLLKRYQSGSDGGEERVVPNRADFLKKLSSVETRRPKQAARSGKRRMFRVRGDKLDNVIGLSGDLSITLSSFESLARTMRAGIDEFSMTLQRLKGVASSLEAGYELATIPHFGMTESAGAGGSDLLDEFDPLELDRYSELNILIRSLNEVVVDLESINEQTSEVQEGWHQAVERQRKVVTEVQNSMQSMQMAPFSILANRLYRTVRESARATRKAVRLQIDGGSIEMDTHIWDVLADPLMHMLRNAVDHGIESPEEREAADKPQQAVIRIQCSRRGSRFIMRLSDDGSGLDYDAIRARAAKLYPDLELESLDHRELAGLIFRQGFSVRKQVTDISGRGVGMDVVRDGVEQLNGTIEVESRQGAGVEFILSIPIAVAQLPALLVRFGGRRYALPMRDVNRVIRIPEDVSGGDTLEVDGTRLPLLRPADIFHSGKISGLEDRTSMIGILVEDSDRKCVLLTDAIIAQEEIVFKNIGAPLETIPFVDGATIMGDGSIVPILKTEDLLAVCEVPFEPGGAGKETGQQDRPLRILFADDSISIRKVLEKFVIYHGWEAVAAHDGVDAMEKIREFTPDIIILDIEMPRMNGFEVLQSLRYQSELQDIPVLMLTSRTADKYREKARDLGASGFVTKPFRDEDLTALITGLAERNNLQI